MPPVVNWSHIAKSHLGPNDSIEKSKFSDQNLKDVKAIVLNTFQHPDLDIPHKIRPGRRVAIKSHAHVVGYVGSSGVPTRRVMVVYSPT
jgi:hypothetical protein